MSGNNSKMTRGGGFTGKLSIFMKRMKILFLGQVRLQVTPVLLEEYATKLGRTQWSAGM